MLFRRHQIERLDRFRLLPLAPKIVRAKRRNPLVDLLQIVGGGAVGLIVAYGILLWGFKVDPFELGKYLPPSMLPASLKSNETASSEMPNATQRNGIRIVRTPTPTATLPAESANSSATANPNAPPTNVIGPPNFRPGSQPPIANGNALPAHPELPPLADSAAASAQPTEELVGPKTDVMFSLSDVSQALTAATQSVAALQAARADSSGALFLPPICRSCGSSITSIWQNWLRRQHYCAAKRTIDKLPERPWRRLYCRRQIIRRSWTSLEIWRARGSKCQTAPAEALCWPAPLSGWNRWASNIAA